MKIIYNNIIPLHGYVAIAFFGYIFARKKYKPLSELTINHELIHIAQAKECGGWLLYYMKYLYYCVRRGYDKNPFELEAYDHAWDLNYLKYRQKNEWKYYK